MVHGPTMNNLHDCVDVSAGSSASHSDELAKLLIKLNRLELENDRLKRELKLSSAPSSECDPANEKGRCYPLQQNMPTQVQMLNDFPGVNTATVPPVSNIVLPMTSPAITGDTPTASVDLASSAGGKSCEGATVRRRSSLRKVAAYAEEERWQKSKRLEPRRRVSFHEDIQMPETGISVVSNECTDSNLSGMAAAAAVVAEFAESVDDDNDTVSVVSEGTEQDSIKKGASKIPSARRNTVALNPGGEGAEFERSNCAEGNDSFKSNRRWSDVSNITMATAADDDGSDDDLGTTETISFDPNDKVTSGNRYLATLNELKKASQLLDRRLEKHHRKNDQEMPVNCADTSSKQTSGATAPVIDEDGDELDSDEEALSRFEELYSREQGDDSTMGIDGLTELMLRRMSSHSAARRGMRLSEGNPYNSAVQATLKSCIRIQTMNMAMATDTSNGSAGDAFRQFALLSVSPETLMDNDKIVKSGQGYLDPFSVKVADPLDMFPCADVDKDRKNGDNLGAEALSTFCYPDGVNIRLLPRCALDGAKRLGWVGKDADRYQLLAFTDGAGVTSHGIAITTREEIFASTLDTAVIVDTLAQSRQKRKAAMILARWWHKCQTNKCENWTEDSIGSGMSKSGASSVKENGKRSKPISRMKSVKSLTNDDKIIMSKAISTPRLKKKMKKMKKKLSNSSIRGSKKEKSKKSSISSRQVTNGTGTTNPSSAMSNCETESCNEILEYDESEQLPYIASNEFEKDLPKRKLSPWAKSRGIEAYREMMNANLLGDVCIVEKSYVLIGGKPREQFLLLTALQQLVDSEREENVLWTRASSMNRVAEGELAHNSASFIDISNTSIRSGRRMAINSGNDFDISIRKENADRQREQRRVALAFVKTELQLSPKQERVKIPKSNLDFICEKRPSIDIAMPLRNVPKIHLTLPLPEISGHWGLARLLLCIGSDSLITVLKLVVLERSVLVLGETKEEVTACACALLQLLKPYEWASTFIPLLPQSMIDFVNSPVPFVAGMAVDGANCISMIESDARVKEAIIGGMSIINLSSSRLCRTSEKSIGKMLFIPPKLQARLSSLQSRLELLSSCASDASEDFNKSSLCSFRSFIRNGLSSQEIVTLHSASLAIREHMTNLAGVINDYRGWEKYGQFDGRLGTFDFYPSKFLEPRRAELEFMEAMARTQLFVGFVDKRRKFDLCRFQVENIDSKRHFGQLESVDMAASTAVEEKAAVVMHKAGVFIANWIYWRLHLKKKNRTSGSSK